MLGTQDANPDAPDWSTLDFDVTCPRCAYNLKLLAQPRCPECGLVFEWAQVVEAARRTRRNFPYFEHRWRDKPVRSLFRTLVACALTRRVWRSVRITDVPSTPGLFIWAALTFLLLAGIEWLRIGTREGCVTALVNGVQPSLAIVGRSLTNIDWSAEFRIRALPFPLLIGFVMVYRRTFVRYRIDPRHLLRVGVYVWGTYASWTILVSIVISGMLITNLWINGAPPRPSIFIKGPIIPNKSTLDAIAYGLHWLPAAVTLASMHAAFGIYLRLPRPWLGAICTLVLVTVALIVICVTFTLRAGDRLLGPWMDTLNDWVPGLDSLVRFLLAI